MSIDLSHGRGSRCTRRTSARTSTCCACPAMQHVFIGHGDSDKLASVNPFSKVYDEVWMAGRRGPRPLRHRRRRRPRRGHRRGRAARSWRPSTSARRAPDAPVRPSSTPPPGRAGPTTRATPRSCTWGRRIVRALLDHAPAGPGDLQAAPAYRHPRQAATPRTPADPSRCCERPWHHGPRSARRTRRPAAARDGRPRPGLAAGGRSQAPGRHRAASRASLRLLQPGRPADHRHLQRGGGLHRQRQAVRGDQRGRACRETVFRERYPSSEAGYLLGEDLAELPAVLQALEHGPRTPWRAPGAS